MSIPRRVAALSGLALMLGAGVAGAQSYQVPTGTATVSSPVVQPGGGTMVSGTGFQSSTVVVVSTTFRGSLSNASVRSAGTTLTCGESASVPADANGNVDVNVVAPAGQTGTCSVQLVGASAQGGTSVLAADITVSADAPAAAGTGLPRTGSDSTALARYGLVLVGVGGLMAVSARRAARLRADA